VKAKTCTLDVMVMMQAVWELELTEMQETACNENEMLEHVYTQLP